MSVITDAIISIKRLTKDTTDTSKEQYQINSALAAVKVQLQPASPAETAIAQGVLGQTYIGFTTTSGILVSDYVTVSGTGEILRVKGIEDWSMDPAPHYELTLVKFDEDNV